MVSVGAETLNGVEGIVKERPGEATLKEGLGLPVSAGICSFAQQVDVDYLPCARRL